MTARPFLGLVGEESPPPINLPVFWHGWLLPVGFCSTRCVLQHLGYFIFLTSHLCTIQKISRGLRSAIVSPFGCFVFPALSEGAPKWYGEPEGDFHVIWSWWYVPIFLVVPLLYLGWNFYLEDIGWRCSCGIILVHWFPS